MKFFAAILTLVVLTGTSVFAQVLSPIRAGSYTSSSPRLTHLTVNVWADNYEVKGNFVFFANNGAEYRFPFQVLVTPGSKNYYGQGQMIVRYGNTTCYHPVSLQVYAQPNGQLFIRHLSSDRVILETTPGRCPPVPPQHVWVAESDPYRYAGPLAQNWAIQRAINPVQRGTLELKRK